jgi:FKBP-type peptidyl-prolyl cis-trans isomerase
MKVLKIKENTFKKKNLFLLLCQNNLVVKGLTNAVIGMCAGDKRVIKMTPDLGYGPKRRGIIPGNSNLHFEFELLSFE